MVGAGWDPERSRSGFISSWKSTGGMGVADRSDKEATRCLEPNKGLHMADAQDASSLAWVRNHRGLGHMKQSQSPREQDTERAEAEKAGPE